MRYNWSVEEISQLFSLPFNDLLFQAQQIHRTHFDANRVQLSTLLSIKTGGCPEDCKYCPQSVHYETPVEEQAMLLKNEVLAAAKEAKARGATRFCMGAAWRSPKGKDFEHVLELVETVKDLGMEACATLGMLSEEQAERLREAGLDYYNHNLDTSPDLYEEIISTRDYQDRLDTLKHVRSSGMNVCCGGIVGMGESRKQRSELVVQLARMNPHPESVPINMLVKIEGTPFEEEAALDNFEFIRTIAVARITMPQSYVRLSAGREAMSDEMQALCFLAGANSVFYGEKLLTAKNNDEDHDMKLFDRLDLKAESCSVPSTRLIA